MDRDINEVFAENVRAKLKEIGWIQADLADAMGITLSATNGFLTGHRGVSLKQAKRIADVLEVRVSDLIGESRSRKLTAKA
jgi:transcriptional regulator with XRE-family HTH domain